MDEIKILTSYISAWSWQILAMLFLSTALLAVSLPTSFASQIVYIVATLIFIICEFISFRKRREFYDSNE